MMGAPVGDELFYLSDTGARAHHIAGHALWPTCRYRHAVGLHVFQHVFHHCRNNLIR